MFFTRHLAMLLHFSYVPLGDTTSIQIRVVRSDRSSFVACPWAFPGVRQLESIRLLGAIAIAVTALRKIVKPLPWIVAVLILSASLLSACAAAAATPGTRSTLTPTAAAAIPTTTFAPSPSLAPPATATSAPASSPAAPVTGNAANGAKLFASLPCASCHDVSHPYPGGAICPNLGNIATEAARIVHSPDYHGHATDAAGYIRESIVNPNAYIVPGPSYRTADGQSVMPQDFGQTLTPSQIDDLVAFLMQHK